MAPPGPRAPGETPGRTAKKTDFVNQGATVRHVPNLLAGVILAAAVGYWGHVRVTGPAPSSVKERGQVVIVDDLDPEYLVAGDLQDPEINAGLLRFRLVADERFVGVGVATVFPESQNRQRPELGQWLDFTGVQDAGGIDMRPWLKQHRPTGPHYLNFGIWVERLGALEMRTGWARFDPSRLMVGGLCIEAPRREAVRLEVRTAGGQAVPGALIAVDRSTSFEVGLISYMGPTGQDGCLIVSGLERNQDWIARLPDGVGPFRKPVMVRFNTPVLDPVVLGVDGMTGVWSFTRHYLRFGLPGESTRIEVAEGQGTDLAKVWPVNGWVGPGRGPWTPFYVTLRQHDRPSDVPIPLTLRFQQGGSVTIKDARETSKITKVTAPVAPAPGNPSPAGARPSGRGENR